MQRQTGIGVNARWRRAKENTQKQTVRALNFTLGSFDFEIDHGSLDFSLCRRVATVYTLCWIHSTFSGRMWWAMEDVVAIFANNNIQILLASE